MKEIFKTIDMIKIFSKFMEETQLIIVDDGSTDAIKYVFNQREIDFIADTYISTEIVSYENNMGKGHAIREGLKRARHQTILLLDADLSVEPHEFLTTKDLFRLEEESLPMLICGQRVQVRSQPFYRILSGKAFKLLVFIKTGLWMDTQCPYKVLHNIPKEVLEYNTDGFAYDVELIMRIKKNQLPIKTQKVAYYNREKSKVTFRKAANMFFEILRL